MTAFTVRDILRWRTDVYTVIKGAGHGSETFVQGIQNSCNPVFIDLGLRIGCDRYYDEF